jgi:hypothetical protein
LELTVNNLIKEIMKLLNINKRLFLGTKRIGYFFLTSLLLASCQDVVEYQAILDASNTSTGAPKITKISPVTDRTKEITGGELSQIIIIQGTNLAGVKAIYFNDVESDIKDVYVKVNEIVLPVPRVLPLEVTNKIKIVTELGETSAPFEVNIPPLVLKGLKNEFALPGDTVNIVGDNFDIYKFTEEDLVIRLNNTSVKIIEATQTVIRVEIPSGAQDNSVISLSSPNVTEAKTIPYRKSGFAGIILDNLARGHWGGAEWQTDGTKLGDPKPIINRPFIHIIKTVGQYSGFEFLNCNTTAVTAAEDLDFFAHPENYYFKFELNTDIAHPITRLSFLFQWNWQNAYLWIAGENGSLNTFGEWETMTFEATDVFTQYQSTEKFTFDYLNDFRIWMNPYEASDLNFSVCNFRVEKK